MYGSSRKNSILYIERENSIGRKEKTRKVARKEKKEERKTGREGKIV